MPIIFVNPYGTSLQEKLEYLKKVAPKGIEVGRNKSSFFAQDGVHKAAYITEDWTRINFWADEAPAWLIELATDMERKTLVPVQIHVITDKVRR
jgi:hypothetical protein